MIKIEIEKQTRQVYLNNGYIGNDGENLQDNLEFSFKDEFVNGQARLEIQFGNIGEKTFITLEKENETYTTPITNVMTVQGKVYAQLVITEGTDEESIPLFKSNIFYFYVNESINAETGDREPYIEWIDRANVKLNQIDNLDIEGSKSGKITTITITKKDGSQEELQLEDGKSIEYNWQGTSLGIRQEGQSEYTYINLKGDKGEAGAIKMQIVNELPLVGSDDTIYLVPITGETGNNYEEYIYVNNTWEKLGGIQVEVDLSNYYTKQETYSKGEVNNLIPDLTDYVKNTDYATGNKAGVIKTNNALSVNSEGSVLCDTFSYSSYVNTQNWKFISKGTLENVITGKELVNKTYVNTLVGDISSALDSINGEVI